MSRRNGCEHSNAMIRIESAAALRTSHTLSSQSLKNAGIYTFSIEKKINTKMICQNLLFIGMWIWIEDHFVPNTFPIFRLPSLCIDADRTRHTFFEHRSSRLCIILKTYLKNIHEFFPRQSLVQAGPLSEKRIFKKSIKHHFEWWKLVFFSVI